MTAPLLPHVPLGGLFGLIEVMAETPGPDDLYRLADRLRLGLDDLHPLLEAAQLLGWARVERGDYELTDEGQRVAAANVAERKTISAPAWSACRSSRRFCGRSRQVRRSAAAAS